MTSPRLALSGLCLVALLGLGCAPKPMDLCKQLATGDVVTKCSEVDSNSKLSKPVKLHIRLGDLPDLNRRGLVLAEGDLFGELIVWANDDEFVANCDTSGPLALVRNPRMRACLNLSIIYVGEPVVGALRNSKPFMTRLQQAMDALH